MKNPRPALRRFTLAILATSASALLLAGTAQAAEKGWSEYTSEPDLFQSIIPEQNQKTQMNTLRLNADHTISYGGVSALVDQRPIKDETKAFSITVQQTFGKDFTDNESFYLLDQQINALVERFKPYGGKIIDFKKKISQSGFPGSEITIRYNDPKSGEQDFKARVLITDVSRFTQTASAPPSAMNSYAIRDFFSMLVIRDGLAYEPGDITEDWQTVKSPLGIFTTFMPEKVEPMVPDAPKIDTGNGAERVMTRFHDPIWNEDIVFSTYGYRSQQPLDDENVINMLKQRHILKNRYSDEGIEYKRLQNGDDKVIEAEFEITAPKGYPYLTQKRLRAVYSENKVMVNEILCSKRFKSIPLVEDLMMLGFLNEGDATPPEQAEEAATAEESPAAETEAEDTTETPAEETSTEPAEDAPAEAASDETAAPAASETPAQ